MDIVEPKETARFIMRHNAKFRMRWDLIVIVLALWNCVFIPFSVAFGVKDENGDDYLILVIVERIIDLAFGLDIIFNFRTSFINEKTNTEVMDPTRIAKNYVLKGRFFIDLLASIPFEVFIDLFRDDTDDS